LIKLPALMVPFLYRCPNTGLKVQGLVADEPTDDDAETYESITCLACARVHLVNPKTGRVLGETDE
jgi:hypothetical protein